MTYEPQPINTSHISLSSDIQELTEELARHAHDVWARQRISEGWSLGAAREDVSKQHPCLRPYDELDDSEKQYDRNAALETLKAIQAMGYLVVLPSPALRAGVITAEDATAAASLLATMRQAEQQADNQPSDTEGTLELSVLLGIWNSRRKEVGAWRCEPEVYRHLSRRFLKLGEAPLAREVALAALTLTDPDEPDDSCPIWESDVKLRQVHALALARCEKTDDAQKILLALHKERHIDSETLGLLARTFKDQAFAPEVSDDDRIDLLTTSLKHYRDAYKEFKTLWTGINVATLERLLGDESESQRVALKIQQDCQAELDELKSTDHKPAETYWYLATLGEANLNLGNFEQAGRYYRQAYEAAPKNFGDLNSTRRQASRLLDHWIKAGDLKSSDLELIDQWLPISRVAVFSGHMIDRPGRTPPRFPPNLADSVKITIHKWLKDNSALIGYSSAACGADLLFQQAIQALGGESRIVLPYDRDDFKTDSVTFAGEHWSQLFDQVLDNATQVIVASPQRTQGDGISYDYANQVVHGLATIRAVELQSNSGTPVGLVVWNNRPGDGPGGTASIVQRWRCQNMDVHQIKLPSEFTEQKGLLPIIRNPTPPNMVCDRPEREKSGTRTMAMLFGDAVNFSQLDEEQVARLLEHFMAPIGGIVKTYAKHNALKNTWGDGLYLVFEHVREAGQCALDICDEITQRMRSGWSNYGLPDDLHIRIALHAGPVLECKDPVTGRKNFTGTHVSRAARLEPKTPPGKVYASQAFAALCAEEEVTEFIYEYVQELDWAKNYGSFPTFVLRRRP